MSIPRYPEAAEVRAGMRRLKIAMNEVELLQKAQIAQAIFVKPISERHEVLLALVAALGRLNEATTLYLALCGLQEGEALEPIREEVS